MTTDAITFEELRRRGLSPEAAAAVLGYVFPSSSKDYAPIVLAFAERFRDGWRACRAGERALWTKPGTSLVEPMSDALAAAIWPDDFE